MLSTTIISSETCNHPVGQAHFLVDKETKTQS